MIMGQRIRFELDDGRIIETTYDGRDVRDWEAEHRKSWLTTDTSVTDITWVSHHAAVRRGELDGELKDYKAFNAVCVGWEGIRRDEGPPDPTEPEGSPKTAGDDSSSP